MLVTCAYNLLVNYRDLMPHLKHPCEQVTQSRIIPNFTLAMNDVMAIARITKRLSQAANVKKKLTRNQK